MSVLDFYAISVIVCLVLTVLICSCLNRVNTNHLLYMSAQHSWIFTAFSVLPLINMVTTITLIVITVGYLVYLIALKLKLKIKLYK